MNTLLQIIRFLPFSSFAVPTSMGFLSLAWLYARRNLGQAAEGIAIVLATLGILFFVLLSCALFLKYRFFYSDLTADLKKVNSRLSMAYISMAFNSLIYVGVVLFGLQDWLGFFSWLGIFLHFGIFAAILSFGSGSNLSAGALTFDAALARISPLLFLPIAGFALLGYGSAIYGFLAAFLMLPVFCAFVLKLWLRGISEFVSAKWALIFIPVLAIGALAMVGAHFSNVFFSLAFFFLILAFVCTGRAFSSGAASGFAWDNWAGCAGISAFAFLVARASFSSNSVAFSWLLMPALSVSSFAFAFLCLATFKAWQSGSLATSPVINIGVQKD